MKKSIVLLLPVAGFFFILTSFTDFNSSPAGKAPLSDGFEVPDDIAEIFDNKCFGCHNTDSRADKAKEKLLIDQLGELSKAKLVGKLGKIGEMAEKKEMPPEKFLQKYPDKALTDDESKKLKDWTDSAAEELLK